MDGNRDDARRCLQLATAALAASDIPKAERLLEKSRRMYPLSAEQDALSASIATARDSKSKPSPSSSSSSSKSKVSNAMPPRDKPTAEPSSNAKAKAKSSATSKKTPRKPDTKPEPPRPATAAMRDAVRAVLHPADKSHYDVLSVPRDADADAIKRAYRKLALRLHPDRNFAPDADDAFKLVSRAFMTLSDPTRRAHYDRYGADDPSDPMPQQQQHQSFSPFATGASSSCHRRRFARAQQHQHMDFDSFFHVNGNAMSPEDLIQFLFTGFPPRAARPTSAAQRQQQQQQQRRRHRSATSDSTSDDDDDDDENSDGDDGDGGTGRARSQNGRRRGRAHGRAQGDEDETSALWERLRPLLWLGLFVLFSVLLSEPGRPAFSLHRSAAHPARHTTRNGTPFFTAAGAQARDPRLWRAADRARLEQLRTACQREKELEEQLRWTTRSWMTSRKERETAKQKLKAFQRPYCDSAYRLYEAIVRYE